ncbi:hypothetical protein [Actinokineospora sp. NBRC 105648]|uniref:hypothetical protein n=1 Tax=Actinokineospora sp. NBRC 105648 TaxID=3032206 RepID=UPI0024A5451D|nr:hypothetical protein [Actinokineospora sp. NBRC 105648]GLZ43258.1 hypothetical protein Acsp05_68820 [Actinokineospora sp. NBRC 105648]
MLAADAQALARELRDSGVEVVYLGDVDPRQLVSTALQEDVDAVITPTDHDGVTRLLALADAPDIAVIGPEDALAWAVGAAGERTHRRS